VGFPVVRVSKEVVELSALTRVLEIFSVSRTNSKIFNVGFPDHWSRQPVNLLLTLPVYYSLTGTIGLFWLQPRNCMKKYPSLRTESENWRTPSGRPINTYPPSPILSYLKNSSGSKHHCNETSAVPNPRLLLLLKKKNRILMLSTLLGPYR